MWSQPTPSDSLDFTNDHTTAWQKLNLLSHPNATLAPQGRQESASGDNLNSLSRCSDILRMMIALHQLDLIFDAQFVIQDPVQSSKTMQAGCSKIFIIKT